MELLVKLVKIKKKFLNTLVKKLKIKKAQKLKVAKKSLVVRQISLAALKQVVKHQDLTKKQSIKVVKNIMVERQMTPKEWDRQQRDQLVVFKVELQEILIEVIQLQMLTKVRKDNPVVLVVVRQYNSLQTYRHREEIRREKTRHWILKKETLLKEKNS